MIVFGSIGTGTPTRSKLLREYPIVKSSSAVSAVDSKKETPTEKSRAISPIKSSTSDEEWASMLAAYTSRGEVAEPPQINDEAEAAHATQETISEDPGSYEPARMPVDESVATEHSCLTALEKLRGGEPDRQEVDYLRKLMTQLRARDVELGYAVNRTAAKLEKGGTVHHITHWLTEIVETQRSHWRRKIEQEGWEIPGHLVSLGEPCFWPVRVRQQTKRRAKPSAWRLAS